MTDVAIADLGLGNLRSVARAFERAGATPRLVDDPGALAAADRLVVPGQGAFEDAAAALEAGFGDAIRGFLASGRPYFGICLGMHILFDGSEEAPGRKGLGRFQGDVRRFPEGMRNPDTGERLKVPHMGWNLVRGDHPFLPAEGWFYFVHSYRCVPADEGFTVGTADYGGAFCAAVAEGPLFACQFHPEKSQDEGLGLIRRFLRT